MHFLYSIITLSEINFATTATFPLTIKEMPMNLTEISQNHEN